MIENLALSAAWTWAKLQKQIKKDGFQARGESSKKGETPFYRLLEYLYLPLPCIAVPARRTDTLELPVSGNGSLRKMKNSTRSTMTSARYVRDGPTERDAEYFLRGAIMVFR